MTDQVLVYIPVDTIRDGDAFTAAVQCKDQASGDGLAPTTLEFRIDCITNDAMVLTWTTVTPGTSAAIALAGAYSAIRTAANHSEVKQITVMADRGLTFQCSDRKRWTVLNADLGA
jgi:hypothetical protein